MSNPRARLLSALLRGNGLKDFVYYLSWEDYASFPDPLPRTRFEVKVEAHNERLANLMVTGIKDYFTAPLG